MSWMVIAGLALVFFGFAVALATATSDKGIDLGWFYAVIFIIFGVVANLGAVIKNADTVDEIYETAKKQDLTVTTSHWRQRPSATEPCKVELYYDKDQKKLFITGVDVLATPETLSVICEKR